ncbi:MAG: DUF4093 domain-containing protein [Clostridia bacterium]|nr:DUF4093 domain-containing protein [Clostridia bacterium]
MIKLDGVVLVEGKYDKIRLSGIVDAPIITTDGFSLFNDKEKIEYLRAVAEKKGLIVITDSDSAGQFIRQRLRGFIDEKYIKNVYLPPIRGKERRKTHPSAEGLLGVEGTDNKIIEEALIKFACTEKSEGRRIEKSDFYALGLTGDGSVEKRAALKRKLSLPSSLSGKALLDAVNILYTYEEFLALAKEVE